MDYKENNPLGPAELEDEIDLMDYVKVMIKRKWLILVIFLVSAIVAGIFSWFSPKIYKISTSLEIGKAKTAAGNVPEQLIESPEQLIEKIQGDVYGVKVGEKLSISEAKWLKIKAENPKKTNLVTISIESAEPDKAKNILKTENELILSGHQQLLDVQKKLLKGNIKTIEGKIAITKSNIGKVKNQKQSSKNNIQLMQNKIETLNRDIESTRGKISSTEDDIKRIENKISSAKEEKKNLEAEVGILEKQLIYKQTPGTQFALYNTKEKLAKKAQEIEDLYSRINSLKATIEDYNMQINSLQRSIEDANSKINSLKASLNNYDIQINSLEDKISDYQSQINSLNASLANIQPTKVVKAPTVSVQPVKPKTSLNIIIAAVLGLFIGIFAAFFAEWWQKNKGDLSRK